MMPKARSYAGDRLQAVKTGAVTLANDASPRLENSACKARKVLTAFPVNSLSPTVEHLCPTVCFLTEAMPFTARLSSPVITQATAAYAPSSKTHAGYAKNLLNYRAQRMITKVLWSLSGPINRSYT